MLMQKLIQKLVYVTNVYIKYLCTSQKNHHCWAFLNTLMTSKPCTLDCNDNLSTWTIQALQDQASPQY